MVDGSGLENRRTQKVPWVRIPLPPLAPLSENWGGARVVDRGRLLSGYTDLYPYRRFESCPPRSLRPNPNIGLYENR